MKFNNDKIELRSEKVRKIIGVVPPVFVRWGTLIIFIVFLIILFAITTLPYPNSGNETIFNHLFPSYKITIL